MKQTSFAFARSVRVLPDGDEIELSDAQATWIDPAYARNADDPRHDPTCDGCTVFGLCVFHSSDNAKRTA